MSGRITAEQVKARVKYLPALPQVWHELDRTLNDDTASPDRVVQLVGQDSALTAVTLKLANSPFYGVSGRVVSLRDAVQILGMQTLTAVTMTAAVMSRFDPDACPGFDMDAHWRHALGTALCAQMLAEVRDVDPCAAYTAGLLHDLGTLALATEFGDAFADALAWADRYDLPAIEAERERLGVDHAEVGGMIATHWRLSPAVAEAVRLHHDVPVGASTPLLDVLHLADNIVHSLDITGVPNDMVPPLSLAAWGRIDPSPDELSRLFAKVDSRLQDLDLGAYA